MNLREAAQQALEALDEFSEISDFTPAMAVHAMKALRAALAEPQTTHWEGCEEVHPECRTAPTPRKPLTDEQIDRVTDQQWAQNNHNPIYAAHRAYARAIERAHGIGDNNGS